MSHLLERVFHIQQRGSNVSTEVLGGLTLFMGSFFNLVATASVLAVGGLPLEEGVMGSAWAGCVGQLLAGLLSNLPISVTCGAGPNLTLAYLLAKSVDKGGLGSYAAALTCCMTAGLIIAALTALGVISLVIDVVPISLKTGICAGIGLLCAFVGFQQVGMVIRGQEGLIGPGDFEHNPEIWLSLAGLVILTVLISRKIPGAFLVTMVSVALIDWVVFKGLPKFEPRFPELPHLYAPDLECLRLPAFWMQTFAMALMLTFDAMGCVFGLAKQAGRFHPREGTIEGGNGMFYAIGLGTTFAAAFGVSPLVIVGNSSAAINDGAKTGLSVCVSAILLPAVGIPFVSVLSQMPPCSSSFVLIYCGVTMFSDSRHVDWNDPIAAVPAFLCIVSQPFLFSIADGIYMGLASSFILNFLSGRMTGCLESRRFSPRNQSESSEVPSMRQCSEAPPRSPWLETGVDESPKRKPDQSPAIRPSIPFRFNNKVPRFTSPTSVSSTNSIPMGPSRSVNDIFSPKGPRASSIHKPHGGYSRQFRYAIGKLPSDLEAGDDSDNDEAYSTVRTNHSLYSPAKAETSALHERFLPEPDVLVL